MTNTKRKHLEDYKNQNLQKVFNTVLESDKISRTNLAKSTFLSPASISLIVEELIKQNYLKETGATIPTSGRAQRLLSVNPDLGSNITFYIDNEFIIAGKVSASMEIEKIITHDIKNKSVEGLLYIINDIYRQWSEASPIISISIGVDSPIDFKNTRVSISTSVSSDFITVNEALSFMVDVPIIIERSVNYAALGESHVNNEKENIYYLNLNNVIKLGGYPFVQKENIAHMKIDKNKEICSCGKTGCLNTFISSQNIIKEMKNKTGNVDVNWHLISEAYRVNDKNIVEVLEGVANYIGKGIVNISSLLNPSLFILGGDLTLLDTKIEDSIERSIKKFGYFGLDNLKVTLSKEGAKSYLIGGAKSYLLRAFQLN